MHAGLIPLQLARATMADWAWEPGIVLPLVISIVVYARGVQVLWSFDERRGLRSWQLASFAAGMTVLVLAMLSPLHEASEQIFSAHMIQHELLMAVAAPLLIVGRPGVVMLWALPPGARRAVGHAVRAPAWRVAWHAASRPFDAWLIHAVIIWCWHLPVLFQATLHNEAIHAAQHLSFLGSALLFWWAVINPRRKAALGLSIVYLFTTAVHTAVLGALMTFSRTPWYPDYAVGAAAWGLSPLEDQQLAGLMMWIPASLAYLIAALVIVRRWLSDSEWRVARDERAAAAS
jgi:putative membrane protein